MSAALRLDWTMPDASTGWLAVFGELTFNSADELLDVVTDRLAERPALRLLRLDCGELGFCDSYGLSTLLMVHRRAVAAGVTLHVDNRSSALQRMLELTGTVEYLAPDGAAEDDRSQSS